MEASEKVLLILALLEEQVTESLLGSFSQDV
jgi:hypothetical protein